MLLEGKSKNSEFQCSQNILIYRKRIFKDSFVKHLGLLIQKRMYRDLKHTPYSERIQIFTVNDRTERYDFSTCPSRRQPHYKRPCERPTYPTLKASHYEIISLLILLVRKHDTSLNMCMQERTERPIDTRTKSCHSFVVDDQGMERYTSQRSFPYAHLIELINLSRAHKFTELYSFVKMISASVSLLEVDMNI